MSQAGRPVAGDVPGPGGAPAPRVALLVVGMHRSGTSAVARVLGLVGAALPADLLPPARDNETGFWEPRGINDLNDEVLAAAGLGWDDLETLPPGWQPAPRLRFAERARALLTDNYGDAPLFALKDPRLCRLLPLWLPVLASLAIEPRFVVPVRNPLEVAESLRTRSGYPLGKSLMLWLKHLLDAEAATRGRPRAFLSYAALLADWRDAITRLGAALDVVWPGDLAAAGPAVDDFLAADRRHHRFTIADVQARADVPEWVQRLYGTLAGEVCAPDAVVTELCDRLAAEVRRADVGYLPVLADEQARRRAQEEIARVQAERIAALEAVAQRREEERAGLERDAAAYWAERDRLAHELAGKGAEIERLSREVWLRDQEVVRLYDEVMRRDRALRQGADAAAARDDEMLRLLRAIQASLSAQAAAAAAAAPVPPPAEPRGPVVELPKRIYWRMLDERRWRQEREVIAASGLFDETFYRERYAGLLGPDADPLAHYVSDGATAGCDPHPLFSTSYYLAANPDVAGTNPFAHWVAHGAAERRNPHPLFDVGFYLDTNPDVAASGVNPLQHYLAYGAAEGRSPHPLFDPRFYLGAYPDVAAARANPLVHFVRYGAAEGRNPHPLFSTSFYLTRNPDVALGGVNALVHYVTDGAAEGRDPHPDFDTRLYRLQHPDVGDANPLLHHVRSGAINPFPPDPPAAERPRRGVCIVTPDIVGPVKNGGIGTACHHFARTLAAAGHEVSILFTGYASPGETAHWRSVYRAMGIELFTLADTPSVPGLVYGFTWFLEHSWRAYEFLRTQRFAWVHFQDWQANGFWSIRAKRVGDAFADTTLTVIMHSSTKWIDEGMQQYPQDALLSAKLVWCENWCLRHCDVTLSPSQHMFDWAAGHGIALADEKTLVPYTFEDAAGEAAAPPPSATPDLDHLIFFGRLETRKGLHVFGDALRRLARGAGALPRRVSLLGKHALVEGERSEDYIARLREELPGVGFIVHTEFDARQAIDYIVASRGVVVMPSLLDNYPLTVVECVQHGIPFVAASTGGIPEMTHPAVLFAPTPDALAALLARRAEIPFATLAHRYSAERARGTWLDFHRGPRPAAPVVDETTRVAVCIPYYDHPRELRGLLQAFARQTRRDFELVVVNDGSPAPATDEFERCAAEFAGEGFGFLSTANQGPGAARNCAAAATTAPLLVFFDSDNVPREDLIERLVRAQARSGADCVTAGFAAVEASVARVTEDLVVHRYQPMGACLDAAFVENVLGDATCIVRRSAFDAIGGFPTGRASWEDHEFLLRLVLAGFTLDVVPGTLYYYAFSRGAGRNERANAYRNRTSLLRLLDETPREELVRLIREVAVPALVARPAAS